MRVGFLVGSGVVAACGGAATNGSEIHPPAAPATKASASRIEPIDPLLALVTPPENRSWIVPGLAQLDLGSPTVQAPPNSPELEVVLLEEQASMVRIAVQLDRLGFALWTERARLLGVVARDQVVSSHPGGEYVPFGPDPIAAELHPGAHVRVLGHKEHWAQVRYLGALEVDGWIPDDSLVLRAPHGQSYRGRIPTGRPTKMVTPGTVIRTDTQWAARQLAIMANGYFLDTINEIDDAWAEIGYEDGDVRVHGYVSLHDPPGQVHKPHDPDVPPPVITPTTKIAAGTCLYAAERGEAIGFVIAESPAELVSTAHVGWRTATFDTPWGPLAFAVQGPTDQDLVTCVPKSQQP